MKKFMNSLFILAMAAAGPAWAGADDSVMAADRAFSQLSVEKGSNAAFLAYSADDVRVFGTGSEPPIFGKAAMAERFKTSGNGDPAKNKLSWSPAHGEVSPDGKLGVTDGTWLFEGVGGKGEPIRATGHYLTVWRLEGSTWRVIADMGTSDPAAK